MNFTVGSSVKISAVFKDDTAALYDPTTVVCTYRKPDGSKSYPAVTHSALGNFYAAITLDTPGQWVCQFSGQGPSALGAIGETAFFVSPSML